MNLFVRVFCMLTHLDTIIWPSHLPKAPQNSSKLWPVRSARMRRSDLSSETPKYLQVAHGENPGPPKTGPKLMVMLPCFFFSLALWFWSIWCSPKCDDLFGPRMNGPHKKSDAIAVINKLCKELALQLSETLSIKGTKCQKATAIHQT